MSIRLIFIILKAQLLKYNEPLKVLTKKIYLRGRKLDLRIDKTKNSSIK